MFGELDDSDIYVDNQDDGGNFMNSFDEDDSFNNSTQFEQGGILGSSYGDKNLSTVQSGLDDEIFSDSPSNNNEIIDETLQGPNEQEPKKQKKLSAGLLYALVLILLSASAAGIYFYKQNNSQPAPPDEQAMGDYFYDKAAGTTADSGAVVNPAAGTATVEVDLATASQPTVVNPTADSAPMTANVEEPVVKPEKELSALEKANAKKKADLAKENQIGLTAKPVTVAVMSGGRIDPFMPYGQREMIAARPKFDLIAPPLDIPEADPVVDELMSTKISGIMYDNVRPSAIVNFGDSDQLVHKGDVVKGFKIVDITKNCVVIKYKANIYQATVGQTLEEGLNLNPVSSLAKQFGGAYTNLPKNIIQFNN